MGSTLRDCIVAEEGYTFLSLDASQIELRVLAILSQDPQMLADIATGDMHTATAIRMYGLVEDPDEMKKRRYRAKTGNFATVYGAKAPQLAATFECSEEEAQEFLDEHRRAYPRMYQWMAEMVTLAKQTGQVKTMFSRIRPLPQLVDMSLPWRLRESYEKEVVNTIVQGTAIDIIKKMMMYMREILPRSVRLVLNVHDEMVWEVPDCGLEEVVEASKELVLAFPDYPCKVEIGKCYGRMEEREVSHG